MELREIDISRIVRKELEQILKESLSISDENNKSGYNIIYNQALRTASDENASYYDHELARYFYCCSTFEQDAIVNELYASIKEQRAYAMTYVAEIFKTSNAYKAYRTIIDVKTEMTDPEGHGSYREAIDKYGVSYQWVLRLGTNALRRLKEKIQNFVKRARKEVKEELASPHINLDAIFEK